MYNNVKKSVKIAGAVAMLSAAFVYVPTVVNAQSTNPGVETVSVEDQFTITGPAFVMVTPQQLNNFEPLEHIQIHSNYATDFTVTVEGLEDATAPEVGKSKRYDVTYHVTDSQGRTKTFAQIVYVTNNAPIIAGVEGVVINQGDAFDPYAGVTAQDTEDGNLTYKVLVDEMGFNSNQPGDQFIKYSVTDADGNTTEELRLVFVEKTSNIRDVKVNQGDSFVALETAMQIEAELGTAYNFILVTEDTVDTSVPGRYVIGYTVVLQSGGIETRHVAVDVIGNGKPVISASDVTIFAGDAFDPKAGVTAYDNEDGDITNKVLVYSKVDSQVAGTYSVKYLVFDNAGQMAEKVITVTVEERSTILLNGITGIDVNHISLAEAKTFNPLAGVEVVAGYESDFKVTVEGKVLTTKPKVDTYLAYPLTYNVQDSTGRVVSFERQVFVTNFAPHLSVFSTTITAGEAFDLLSIVTAEDLEDGIITNKVEVKENGFDANKPGTYSVEYSVTDTDGNTTNKIITITVK